MIEWIWVAWRDKWGWHPRHAVPTQLDAHPDECAGLMTVCGHYVPEGALEYSRYPHGPCRKHERESPVMTTIMRNAYPDADACAICRERLAKERPDLYS